jgi:YidC/Oxa1 family membrane protein insertase
MTPYRRHGGPTSNLVDKKNSILGAIFFVAAFGVLIYSQKFAPQRPAPAEVRREVAKETGLQGPALLASTDQATFTTARSEQSGSSITSLSNSFVEVHFTDAGGSIRDVAFRKYPAALHSADPFIFNALHASPMLAIVGVPGLDLDTRYQVVAQSATDITFRAVLEKRLEVTRHYVISPDKTPGTDPYVIRSETTLRNLTDAPSAPLRLAVSIGTAAPSSAIDNGLQLTTEYWNGSDQTLVKRAQLEQSGGFLGMGAHAPVGVIQGAGPVAWATVKNQFFAAILTPDEPASGLETRRVKLLELLPDEDRKAYGITGAVDFDVPALPAHGQSTLAGDFYVGPKEYPRLSNADVFHKDQDRIMDFGNFVFRFCAAILLTTMTWIHKWVGNWGVAIILTTLALKFAFLPITLAQSRSSRRMQKLMPEMKLIKEKFKDNAQKQQQATMELYKKHKVNPLAGCLPMLLTIPFFFAFFRMLQSASELRFGHFLWAHDLSGPDTVATLNLPYIGVLAINVLPILLGLVNFFQMRVTPQPAVDNAQMKIMKFMPVFFVVFYYNWPSAIALYSTVNGIFTISQQLVVNRMKDTADTAPLNPGKPTKNVTPKKKR